MKNVQTMLSGLVVALGVVCVRYTKITRMETVAFRVSNSPILEENLNNH